MAYARGLRKGRCLAWLAVAASLCVLAGRAGGQPPPAPPTPTLPPLPPGVQSQVPTEGPLTLREAIGLALREQPQVALAASAASAAAGRTRQAISAYLPSISVSSQYTRTGPGPSGVGAVGGRFVVGGYTTSFTTQQLLYDFGKTPAQIAQARDQQESARQAFAQTRQDVVNQVKQAYYTLLQNQRLVAVQQQNVADQQAHLELAQARFKAGLAPRADVVRADTAVADAVLNLASAQNTAAISRVTLNLTMGVDVRSPTRPEETEEPLPTLPDPAALVAQALTDRPDVQQARADVEAAQQALHQARVGNLPSLVTNANYGLRGTSFPPTQNSWAVGLGLQWAFLDWGLTAGRVQEAEGNLHSARARLRQAQQTASSDVVQAYLNVQTADEKVTASKAGVANAEEGLRVATGRYQAGVAAYIEVIDAETALLTARTNQVNAQYGLSTARAALTRALGIEEAH